MHFRALVILASQLLFPITSVASAISHHQSNSSEYKLRTQTTDSLSDKNGLYVTAYHTGAGLNDAVLGSNIARASRGFLNDTHQLFDFETTFPWGLNIGGGANYGGELPHTKVLDVVKRLECCHLEKAESCQNPADPISYCQPGNQQPLTLAPGLPASGSKLTFSSGVTKEQD